MKQAPRAPTRLIRDVSKHPTLGPISRVISKFKHVSINSKKLARYANGIGTYPRVWTSHCPIHFDHDLENGQMVAFLLVFNALSFSYWPRKGRKWTVDYLEREQERGTWSMIAALKKALDEGFPILDPEYLKDVPLSELKFILKSSNRTKIPLLEQRLQALQELAAVREYGGFGNFVKPRGVLTESSDELDALALVRRIVATFPSFEDSAEYLGERIEFNKRAQLFVSDISHSFIRGYNFGLSTLELTACADYILPMVLRDLGILEYSSELAQKVDSGTLIEKAGEMEVEIRASTLWAVELMRELIWPRIQKINSMIINDHLWILGQEVKQRAKYHLTDTIAY